MIKFIIYIDRVEFKNRNILSSTIKRLYLKKLNNFSNIN